MTKFALRTSQERNSALRKTILIWAVAAALIGAAILFLSRQNSLPTRSKTIIMLAVVALVWRQIARRMKTKTSHAVEPDPESKLKLD